MIAPIQDGHPADPRPLREVACAAFQPGGALAGLATGDFEYEARPQQVEMARAVSDALESSRHLVVEAGTGVGKSLAYLVPLILHAKRAHVRAMVSTHTISLQEQLVGKDLPLLKDRLGVSFRAALVKGRSFAASRSTRNCIGVSRFAHSASVSRQPGSASGRLPGLANSIGAAISAPPSARPDRI